jgi:hypothetical protein
LTSEITCSPKGATLVLSTKHRKTLEQIFERPVRPDIRWSDIESLFKALGGSIEEKKGSIVVVRLGGRPKVFHRPHPRPETDKGAVKSVRIMLESLGITP